MVPQKLVVLFTSLTGGAIGLFAPIGMVKWLLQIEPEDAGILTLFFFPIWCLLLVVGLLIGRRLGVAVHRPPAGLAGIAGSRAPSISTTQRFEVRKLSQCVNVCKAWMNGNNVTCNTSCKLKSASRVCLFHPDDDRRSEQAV